MGTLAETIEVPIVQVRRETSVRQVKNKWWDKKKMLLLPA